MRIRVVSPKSVKLQSYAVGLDVETYGFGLDDPIATVQLYDPELNEVFLFPVNTVEKVMSDSERSALASLLESHEVVGHNLQFDLARIHREFGVMPTVGFDTFLVARAFQFDNQDLESVAVFFFPQVAGQIPSFESTCKMEGGRVVGYSINNPALLKRAAYHAVLPVKIRKCFESWEAWSELAPVMATEFSILPVFSELKSRGLMVDSVKYQSVLSELAVRTEAAQAEFTKLAGRNVKIHSPRDLARFLYDESGFPEPPVRTKKGNVSTSQEALLYLAGNPVVDKLLELKHLDSVYRAAKVFPERIGSDGRIHPETLQIGFDATSRIYTKDPSINQLPLELRDVVVADSGCKFLYCDWSAAELYVAAKWAGCGDLVDRYDKGLDLHTYIASRLLGLSEEDVTPEQREVSKVVVFSAIYGSEGEAAARALRISSSEGQALVSEFFILFPEIKKFRDVVVADARKRGYTKTYFGRRRQLPGIRSEDPSTAVRQAFNTAIQGTVADCLKLAISKLRDERLVKKGIRYAASVFDSLLLQVPEDFDKSLGEKVLHWLSDCGPFRFRFKMSEGHTWKECQVGGSSSEGSSSIVSVFEQLGAESA